MNAPNAPNFGKAAAGVSVAAPDGDSPPAHWQGGPVDYADCCHTVQARQGHQLTLPGATHG